MSDGIYQEIENPQELLDINGCIIQEGWARRPLFHYDRKFISVPVIKTKEWERFIISDDGAKWLVIATVNHIGARMGYSITYVDFEQRSVSSVRHKHRANEKNRLSQSSHVDDENNFSCPEMRTAFIRRGNTRNIVLCAPKFDVKKAEKGIDARFILNQDQYAQSYVTSEALTKNRKNFLLDEIYTLIPVSGIFRRGNEIETILPDKVHATIDWGRGRFSTKPMFKALFSNGRVALSMINRNCCAVSIDGKIYMIKDISTKLTRNGFTANSADGRLNLTLKDGIPLQTSSALQIFGCIQGSVTLENEKPIDVSNMPGVTWRISKQKKS